MTEIQNERDAVDALLPWYAAGRLSADDTARVEAALRIDSELARRLSLAQDEMDETIRVNQRLGAPSPRVIETLFAKIDAEPTRLPVGRGLAGRLSAWLSGFAPRTLAYGAMAAAVVLLAQAGVIGTLLLGDGAGEYSTASYTKFDAPEGSYVLVGFAEGATAARVLDFLKANNAVIVDGPRAGGMFKLRISADKLPREEVDKIAQRMRGETELVKLAAPTQ